MKNKEKKNKKSTEKLNKKTDKKSKLGNVLLVLLGILLLAGLVVFLWYLSGEGKQPADTVVFEVGTEKVYLDEVNLYCLENMANLGITEDALDRTTASDGTDANTYYKEEIKTLIVNTKVYCMKAKEEGITLTEDEKKQVRNDAATFLQSVSGNILNSFGITKETVIASYSDQYLAKKMADELTKDIEVESQNFCTMYFLMFPKIETDENGNYVKDSDNESPILLSDEEIAKQKENADAAYEDLKNGDKIEDVAKKYNVDLVSGEQSNLADSFESPFNKYAKSLKKGEFSEVIDIESCYLILQMVNENNEDYANQIMAYYRLDKASEILEEELSKLYDAYEVNEAYVEKGNIWKEISLYDFAQYVEEE